MKKQLLFLLILVSACCHAQDYYVPEGYIGWYDYDHQIIVRRNQWCTENFQDLWNGCYVKQIGSYFHVYNGTEKIVYGTDVALLHNGYYMVSRDNDYTYRLYDPEGNSTSAWGYDFRVTWKGTLIIMTGNDQWRLFDENGDRTSVWGDFIYILWNGSYVAVINDICYLYSSDFKRIYITGDDITLTSNGNYKVTKGSYCYYYNQNGERIY